MAAPCVEKIVLSLFEWSRLLCQKSVGCRRMGSFLDSQFHSVNMCFCPNSSTTMFSLLLSCSKLGNWTVWVLQLGSFWRLCCLLGISWITLIFSPTVASSHPVQSGSPMQRAKSGHISDRTTNRTPDQVSDHMQGVTLEGQSEVAAHAGKAVTFNQVLL